ncbi:hypothetical protein [Streptomyces sp. R41]|uniref:Uncharacterized protein n=1 Tax=Streptomyces sp. R41 TaxID=3238632 RepID=A0AB39RSJ7_9ACTN
MYEIAVIDGGFAGAAARGRTACELPPVSRTDDHRYPPGENSVIRKLITGYRALTDAGEAVRPWGH